jgi:etoposide-induced 2.4 mRNA
MPSLTGFPYAAICTFGSSLASAALFALLFPVVSTAYQFSSWLVSKRSLKYIIMAIHARPVPMDPYSPSPSPNTGNIPCHPSPFIPIRLPIFAVVIWLNDWIVWGLSLGGGNHSRRHRRYGSVASDTAESIEMGEIVEPIPTRASWRGPQSRRRKVD